MCMPGYAFCPTALLPPASDGVELAAGMSVLAFEDTPACFLRGWEDSYSFRGAKAIPADGCCVHPLAGSIPGADRVRMRATLLEGGRKAQTAKDMILDPIPGDPTDQVGGIAAEGKSIADTG